MEFVFNVEFVFKVVGNGVNEGSCKFGDNLILIREYDNAHGRY